MGPSENSDHGSIIAAVHGLRERDYCVTPLKGKNPAVGGVGWPNREHGDEEFVPGTNVGVTLTDGLVDIDLDSPEARRAAPHLLPPTPARFGRPSSRGAHYLYQTSEILPTIQFSDPTLAGQAESKRMLVELRGGDRTHQTMFPPSIHPGTGERVEWEEDGKPADVQPHVLVTAVSKLAAASLLGRYWPKGNRHLAALALAGWLVRAGWTEEQVIRFMAAVAAAAEDEEVSDRIRAVQDTFHLSPGDPAIGWTRLRELLGERASILSKVREWLGVPAFDVLLNQVALSGIRGPAAELDVVWGNEVSEQPIVFAWPGRLAMGKLAHFAGDSSQGKSPLTVDIAARVSTAADWPDGAKNHLGPKSVIMLNIEDDLRATILPRFRLAGGDKSKLCYVKGTKRFSEESDSFVERGLALDSDFRLLEEKARSIPDLGLIVIDPITNYLGHSKMNAEEEMRKLLTPLATLAADLGIVIITVGHLNRREKGTRPQQRIMGAGAFGGVARTVYAFGPDPEDASKFSHVMTTVRAACGEAPALRYRTEMVTDNCPDGPPLNIIKVVWTGTSTATAEDTVDPTSSHEKSQERAAGEALSEFLRDGCRSSSECLEQLKGEGFEVDKLNPSRIRDFAGVKSKKFAGNKFYSWYIEDGCTDAP